MRKFFVFLVFSTFYAFGQNVGINATGAAPSGDAGLDVNFTDKGVLIPRVNLTSTTTYGLTGGGPTNSMLVYNTNSGITGTGAYGTGFYYWSTSHGRWIHLFDNMPPGTPWIVGGNNEAGAAGTAYNFGHIGNHHIDIISNNSFRGRISNLGEFFWGTNNTVITGDLLNVVSNNTFPWAINGYSDFNGSGVYGSVTSGPTLFAAVQGEYVGSNLAGPGIRGSFFQPGNGSAFTEAGLRRAVHGTQSAGNAQYAFGVFGSVGSGGPGTNFSIRSGGVFGWDLVARGALGYYTSGNLSTSVYGFGNNYTTGVAGGKFSQSNNLNTELPKFDNHIGLGIYGGVMGGWIKGLIYGTNLSGKKYGLYVHGKTITNNIIATLHNKDGNGKRIVTYSSQSIKPEIIARGKNEIVNGQCRVTFEDNFKKLIDPDNLIINITPIGNNSIFIDSYDNNGFTVKSNSNNRFNFFWQAVSTIKDIDQTISDEILDSSFEEKINGNKGVMFNDNNPEDPEYSIWWDGNNVRFDKPPTKEELIKRGIIKAEDVEQVRYKPKK
ncbi:MAG: hypothetical protein N3F09_08925 [Bacteroidia bacterium]|nr:hypothetical protein [Bacteroidia bacterium]